MWLHVILHRSAEFSGRKGLGAEVLEGEAHKGMWSVYMEGRVG